MKEKILHLKRNGLNSLEISNKLLVDKKEIDVILLDAYLATVHRAKFNKEAVKTALLNFHNDPNTTLKKECIKCNCCSVNLGRIFINAGIELQHKSTRISHKFTENDYKNMVNLFSNGKTLKDIAHYYNTQGIVISKFLKKKGFNPKRYQINETFFETIDTEEKAYWLGFLYADGNVAKNRYTVSCDLKQTDVEHLVKFCKTLNISLMPRLDPKLKRARFAVSNKKLISDLIKLGCVPCKSLILTFPSKEIFETEDLIKHFVRGYFDGDGCISYSGNNYYKPRCCILGTRSILENIEKYSCTKWTWYQANPTSDLIFDIKSNIATSIKFLNWIYEDATIFLERKYNRYLLYKNKNFAVLGSDFKNNDRAISEKAKLYIQEHYPEYTIC